MRSEKEMYDLILKVANEDERIRAVLLVGSRANPEIPKDNYQDYDITYFVKDVQPFYNNMEWITQSFGEPAIAQLPELNKHPLLPPMNDGHFTYLMIFADGNRIDLSVVDQPYGDSGEPAMILLDKDGYLPHIVPDNAFFYVKRPDEHVFGNTCNEFWWCLNNVAKGIARDELPYTMEMFNRYVRDMLNQMTEWYIGIQTDFGVSAGKMGKYFKEYLPSELYNMYTKTYSDSDYLHLWEAVFTACELFRIMAVEVADFFGFDYNQKEEEGMMRYLDYVRSKMI